MQRPNKRSWVWTVSALLAFSVTVAVQQGCGKPSDTADAQSDSEDGTPVSGNAVFGSQCPYGSIPQTMPVRVRMWDGPGGLHSLDLAESLQPLVLEADCKKKILTIRSMDGKFDSAWEFMPDGSFYFTVDGGIARLRNDGAGHADCQTRLQADLFGKIDCADRDKANLQFDTIWWMNGNPNERPAITSSPVPGPSASPAPVPSLTPAPAALTNPCSLPRGSYLHTTMQIHQCQ